MKYKEVETIATNGKDNDCYHCCFALNCISPCRLPKGRHYEEVK